MTARRRKHGSSLESAIRRLRPLGVFVTCNLVLFPRRLRERPRAPQTLPGNSIKNPTKRDSAFKSKGLVIETNGRLQRGRGALRGRGCGAYDLCGGGEAGYKCHSIGSPHY